VSRLWAGADKFIDDWQRCNKSRCFESVTDGDTGLTPELGGHIVSLAGQINAHREGEGWHGMKVPARPSAK